MARDSHPTAQDGGSLASRQTQIDGPETRGFSAPGGHRQMVRCGRCVCVAARKGAGSACAGQGPSPSCLGPGPLPLSGDLSPTLLITEFAVQVGVPTEAFSDHPP